MPSQSVTINPDAFSIFDIDRYLCSERTFHRVLAANGPPGRMLAHVK